MKYDPTENAFVKSPDGDKSVLPQVIWHITDLCALSCPFCFATKTGIATDFGRLEEYTPLFKTLKTQKVDIAGGEPLRYRYLSEACQLLHNNDIYMTITTSGDGIPEIKEWLIKHASLFTRVIVSIDGPTPERHDQLRGKKGLFGELKELVRLIKENGYSKIRVNTVVTRELLTEENLVAISNLVMTIGPIEWCLIEPHPVNKKDTFDQYSVTSEEFTVTVSKINEYCRQKIINYMKISIRYSTNYSAYWVLHPNGILIQDSSGVADSASYEFSLINLQKIRSAAMRGPSWVPMINYEGRELK